MVNFSFTALAALALAPLISANPTPSSDTPMPFSFEQWAIDISADPTGDHLSPDEAIAAWKATNNFTESENSLTKRRGGCGNLPHENAYAPDAVKCINFLAGKGSNTCDVDHHAVFCSSGRAKIMGITGGGDGTNFHYAVPCLNIAESAGKIMDRCYRSDKTVQGYEFASQNTHIAVHISGPIF